MSKTLFKRKTLDQICTVPDKITDVYVVEHHIWADGGSPDAKQKRQVELTTLREFLIEPVRALLYDVLKRLAAPYDPSNKDNPVGQGWWIQAEFGSGKSHLLSSIGAMALGNKDAWADKQKRQAEHIEKGYRRRGVREDEAESRAWATVNKMTGGGKLPGGSGRGKKTNKEPAKKGGRLGGRASAQRPAADRSASAKKAARTRKRHAAK